MTNFWNDTNIHLLNNGNCDRCGKETNFHGTSSNGVDELCGDCLREEKNTVTDSTRTCTCGSGEPWDTCGGDEDGDWGCCG